MMCVAHTTSHALTGIPLFLPPLVGPQLACDGLWEQFTNQGAVDFVRASLQRGENAQDAANSLVAEALRRQV